MKNTINNPQLLNLGGITGILTGVLIITFFISSALNNIFFVPEIYTGDSIANWMQSLEESKSYASWHIIIMTFGFASMLLTAFILYQIIPNNSWQKNVSITGYALGGALVFPALISHQSLENYILTLLETGDMTYMEIQDIVGAHVYYWMDINMFFVPFFIVVIGTGFMSWALKSAGLIPKWFFIWAIVVSLCLFLSFFSVVVPAFSNLSNVAPFHMIWFSVMGVFLLRMKTSKAI